MNRSALSATAALALAALAAGVPNVAPGHGAVAAAACACHHAGRAPCHCPRGGERIVRSASCLSACCRLPESAQPSPSATDPFVLTTATVLPRPTRRWSPAASVAAPPGRSAEPETPPPRLA